MERAAVAVRLDGPGLGLGSGGGGLRVPVSPKLKPAGGPGPVTPWELDGEGGYLGRGG